MTTLLRDLLHAPGLDLVQAGSAPADVPVEVSWAAVTEQEDPTAFLTGGEIVLTTGVRLRTAAQQERFVASVAAAGVAAVGFGVGLGHRSIPAAVRRGCDATGLPLLRVPLPTPFAAISRLIAERLVSDHVGRLSRLLADHQSLAAALLSGQGIGGFLTAMSTVVDGTVALERYGTEVFRAAPPAAAAPAAPAPDRSTVSVAVATGLPDRCVLHVQTPRSGAGPAGRERAHLDSVIALAQNLLAVQLSQEARVVREARLLAGQVLGDVVSGRLGGEDAAVRLASLGIDAAQRHVMVVVEPVTPAAGTLLGTLPATVLRQPAAPTALVEDRLVMAVPTGRFTAGDGDALLTGLETAGLRARAGAGAAYARPEGLRWSYFEALEALREHPGASGFATPRRLTLTSLLLAAQDAPLADLAADTLAPLRASDAAHGTALVRTLTVFLEANAQAGDAAAALGVHRNTVRHRLARIAELTGFDPAVTADQVHLWLALAQDRLAGRPGGPGPAPGA